MRKREALNNHIDHVRVQQKNHKRSIWSEQKPIEKHRSEHEQRSETIRDTTERANKTRRTAPHADERMDDSSPDENTEKPENKDKSERDRKNGEVFGNGNKTETEHETAQQEKRRADQSIPKIEQSHKSKDVRRRLSTNSSKKTPQISERHTYEFNQVHYNHPFIEAKNGRYFINVTMKEIFNKHRTYL